MTDQDLDTPALSIIMPAYNAEPYIDRAIGSILAQTYTDFELIVYVDASPDRTADIARARAAHDARIHVIVGERNLGVCGALNRAIETARGDLIGRLDADDVAAPDRFERQIALMRSDPQIVVVGSDAVHINANDEPLGLSIAGPRSIADFHDRRSRGELTVVLDGTALMRRDVFELVGGYDPAMDAAPEVDLQGRMAAHGAVVAIDEPLISYRLHPGSNVDTKFFAGRAIHRFVEMRETAILRGETPPTFDEYTAAVHVMPVWRRAAIRLSDVAQFHYRSAGVHLAEGNRGRAMASLGRAAAANPLFVIRRAWNRRFSPQARRRIRGSRAGDGGVRGR